MQLHYALPAFAFVALVIVVRIACTVAAREPKPPRTPRHKRHIPTRRRVPRDPRIAWRYDR